ncbi:hypothetical protein RFI_25264 [Reticulomyxa filosa]|uniref:Uncharacterized protein n=1 Tax=Reticulomyxa filosa TaxID=46433 RepID=X6MFB6_RETFI|nr:hypothetical protein RFI_25264 [Reticulomyxa filosa]|eukprot:ETO12112.1 hypothetical protein RFI_25264 [Reticulomyxa filosa]
MFYFFCIEERRAKLINATRIFEEGLSLFCKNSAYLGFHTVVLQGTYNKLLTFVQKRQAFAESEHYTIILFLRKNDFSPGVEENIFVPVNEIILTVSFCNCFAVSSKMLSDQVSLPFFVSLVLSKEKEIFSTDKKINTFFFFKKKKKRCPVRGCDKTLKYTTVKEAYQNTSMNMAGCDGCEKTLENSEHIYHCGISNETPNHKYGYDLCPACAQREAKKNVNGVHENNTLR